jgi:hypothetical protein
MPTGNDTEPMDALGRSITALVQTFIDAERVAMPDRPGIDGDLTAERAAAEAFTACRDGEKGACVVVARWLNEAALAAVREYGEDHGLSVWERAGRPLDVGPYLP